MTNLQPINSRALIENVSALRVRIAKTERFAAQLAADVRRTGGAR